MLIKSPRVVKNCFHCNAYYFAHEDNRECPYCERSVGFFYSDKHFIGNITLYGIKLEDIKVKQILDFVTANFDFIDGKAIRKEVPKYTASDSNMDFVLALQRPYSRLVVSTKEVIESILHMGKKSGKIKNEFQLILVKDLFEEIEEIPIVEVSDLQEYKNLGGVL